jgi:hypothetical protein
MSWRKLLARSRKQGSALPQEQEQPDREGGEPLEDCSCQASDMTLLSEIATDEKEVVVIGLLREAFSGFCTGSVQHWNAGFNTAGEWVGEDGGTILFAHVLALARAIKSDRFGTFYFQPGHCGRVTDDEVLVLAMLQAARRNDLLLLASLADRMAQGGAPMRVHHAAFRLGCMIEAMGRETSALSPPPTAQRPTTVH